MSNSWRCFTTKWDTECIFLFVSFVYVLREPIQRKITDIMLLNIVFNSRWLFDGFLAPAWGHVVAKVRFFSFSLLVSTCPENENDQKTRKTAKDAQRLPQTLQELQRAGEIPRETDTSPETLGNSEPDPCATKPAHFAPKIRTAQRDTTLRSRKVIFPA